MEKLAQDIKNWGMELGFQQVGITDTDLTHAEEDLKEWLKLKYHGEMDYMQRHGTLRTRPAELLPKTIRIIVTRLNYLEMGTKPIEILNNPNKAYVSRYALGRDYHKLIRKKLQKLANKIEAINGPFTYRAFADSAPVMEKPLAAKAGLGWQGKNTMILNKSAGSWFFLGVLFTDLPLPIDKPVQAHCGSCTACIDVCPTKAIVSPYKIDASRCISYHTIELKGAIPKEFRKPMGNRIYGCDDCQLFCPFTKFSPQHTEKDFTPRHNLSDSDLIDLFNWDEPTFLKNTEGSAIRRIGYERWLRNIAVALGNAPTCEPVITALKDKLNYPSDLVQEHVQWALAQHA